MKTDADTGRRLTDVPAEVLASGLDRSVDAVALLDDERRHVDVNPAYARLFGYDDPAELEGHGWDAVVPGDELEDLRERASTSLEDRGSWRDEVVARRRDGSSLAIEMTLNLLDDGFLLAVARDLTEQQMTRERLERMAYYDPLTGLANRRLLREKTEHAFAVANRHGHEVGLLYLDLNSFKELNDSLGHTAGDRALEEVARRLESSVRDSDTASRVGGDEFAVLLEEVAGEKGAVRAARRIQEALEPPFDYQGHEIQLSAGIGVAFFPRYASDFEELVHQADLAMYGASRSKSSGLRIYRPEHGISTPRHSGLVDELHRALRHYRLELHYQPILDLDTGEVRGAEALVRWPHPRLGLLSAAKFLPLVEETGLLERLDRWVLAAAALQLQEWSREGFDGCVAVHLSEPSGADPELPAYLETMLATADGFEPGRLVLQLPATSTARGNGRLRDLRAALTRLGTSLALNGFAPGLVDLSALRDLAPEVLTLDRSVVGGVRETAETERLVRVAVDVGHTLGAKVVAKGVERPDQQEVARRAGCDFAAGYLVGWSVPPDEFPVRSE
jgi:diguanylate cyclase (GGDEF)-like protein/PAS domain S-box-containing protein